MAIKATIGEKTFHVGDTVGIHYKLIEKEKVAGRAKREVKEQIRERTQVFEGIVISIKGERNNKTFTVRKIAAGGIGVERIFPLISPWIKKITVKRQAKVRRAKLYYLRKKVGKKAFKLKERVKKKVPKKKKTNKQKSTPTKNPEKKNEKK